MVAYWKIYWYRVNKIFGRARMQVERSNDSQVHPVPYFSFLFITMTPSAKPRLPENIQAAVEDTVGLKGEKKWGPLAEALGLTEGVLRNKVAGEKDENRHDLSLAEAIEMARASGNHILVKAICNEFGGEFLHYPGLDETSDNELLSRYTSMMRELGQFSNDIHVSLADGKITAREIADLRKDFLRLSGALSEVMDRLQDRANRDLIESKTERGPIGQYQPLGKAV